MLVFVILISIMMGVGTVPKGPRPMIHEAPAWKEMGVGEGPGSPVVVCGTLGAVIVKIRVFRSAVRNVVLASALKSFIADVSDGTGAAVAGGAVRNRSEGAGRRRKSAGVERGPRRAGKG